APLSEWAIFAPPRPEEMAPTLSRKTPSAWTVGVPTMHTQSNARQSSRIFIGRRPWGEILRAWNVLIHWYGFPRHIGWTAGQTRPSASAGINDGEGSAARRADYDGRTDSAGDG